MCIGYSNSPGGEVCQQACFESWMLYVLRFARPLRLPPANKSKSLEGTWGTDTYDHRW